MARLRIFYNRIESVFKSWLSSKNGYYSAVCFSYVLLAVLSISLISKVRMFSYGTDQFGYWGIAASIVGYDWYDLLALNDYYSFGYSILLIPLYLLNRLGVGMTTIHILAILINGCFLILSFKMANYVARKMFPHLNRYYSLLICLVTTLYVNNLVQVYTAWTETCLYFVFWCILVCLIKVLEKPRIKYIFLLLLLTAYIFTVHMRALGVVISVVLILTSYILFNRRKFSGKQIILILIMCVALFLAVACAKEWVTGNIYANNSYLATNDFSGQTNKIVQSTTTITGLFGLLLSVLGKLYYVGVSSWGIAFLALAIILFKVFEIIGRGLKEKKIMISSSEIFFVFTGMAGMAQIFVNAMYKSFRYDGDGSVLADTILHGRYTDFIIGPLLLIGFAVLPKIHKYFKEILLSLLAIFICALTVQTLFDRLLFYPQSILNLRPIAIPSMLYLFPEGFETGAIFPAFITMTLFLVIIMVNLYERTKENLIKRIRISLVLLVMTGGIWGGMGMKTAFELLSWDDFQINTAELLSNIDKETDVYLVSHYSDYIHDEVRNIQWFYPELNIQIITPEDFEVKEFDKETIYISRADNYPIMAQVSDDKRLLYDSGSLCIYAEPGSKVEQIINKELEAVYSGGRLIKKSVDLMEMLTDLSYQKYNGSLYYNYNGVGYITWNTGLKLSDGIYEFIIDMEISGLTETGEIGYITVTDEKESYQKTYPLKEQDFNTDGRGEIKVQGRAEDFAEPIIGIYNYGDCSMKVQDVSYQQIRGNIALEGKKEEYIREIGGIVTQLNHYKELAINYVDSDSSALNGFPDFKTVENDFPTEITEIIPGILISHKKNIGNRYYIVENTDNNETLFNLLEKGNMVIYKNEAFTLMIPDNDVLRRAVTEQGRRVLADGKRLIDARFFYEPMDTGVRLSEMSDISLPRGRYEVSVDFKIEETDGIDAALVFLNGEEIKITQEMLDENRYSEAYELELTESSADVRLGLFASRQSRITDEYIGVKRIGNCYGYIQKIPVYDLACENAVCYADSIITDELAESNICLHNFPLEFGEYMLAFTGQQTAGSGTARIKIYRNGVLRTDEPLMFGGEGEQEFTFEMNEYEPAEWDFEIICPVGNRLELSDFEIVR